VVTGLVVEAVTWSKTPPSVVETDVLRPSEASVVEGYAQVIQESLRRRGRAPFVLGGVALYDDLGAIQQSLARCLHKREDAHLRHWHDVFSDLLPDYAEGFAEIQKGQAWVNSLRKVLEDVPLPTFENPGPGADAVALEMAHTLGTLGHQIEMTPWLDSFRQHLFGVSERYWSGLFVCYDIVGLPRTNNELENLFGQTKRNARRQSGLSQVKDPLHRQGAWLIYTTREESVTKLQRRISHVPIDVYRAERTRFESRQERFRHRCRWRRNRPAILTQLENDWTPTGFDTS